MTALRYATHLGYSPPARRPQFLRRSVPMNP